VEGGNEYDTATEPVAIDRESSAGQANVNVTITLKPKGAAAAFNKIPKAARENYSKGLESVEKGDSAKAVEYFKKAVDVDPQFALAWSQLGEQQLKLGQLDPAIESLRTALKLDPTDINARQNLGIALLNKNEFAEAEKELREVVSKNAKSATAHMYLGITLSRLKKDDEAEAELVRAIGLPGGDKLALAHKFLGALYWKKGQKQQAADELEKYVTLSPKAPDAERIRGTIKELRSNK
jgi:superkiller protein 3